MKKFVTILIIISIIITTYCGGIITALVMAKTMGWNKVHEDNYVRFMSEFDSLEKSHIGGEYPMWANKESEYHVYSIQVFVKRDGEWDFDNPITEYAPHNDTYGEIVDHVEQELCENLYKMNEGVIDNFVISLDVGYEVV